MMTQKNRNCESRTTRFLIINRTPLADGGEASLLWDNVDNNYFVIIAPFDRPPEQTPPTKGYAMGLVALESVVFGFDLGLSTE